MKLTIIGAGPGGYTAAFAAAEKGIEILHHASSFVRSSTTAWQMPGMLSP